MNELSRELNGKREWGLTEILVRSVKNLDDSRTASMNDP